MTTNSNFRDLPYPWLTVFAYLCSIYIAIIALNFIRHPLLMLSLSQAKISLCFGKSSLNWSVLLSLWGKVCLCFTQLWPVLISHTCWTVTLWIRPNLAFSAPKTTKEYSKEISLPSFSIFHLGMLLLHLGCTWWEMIPGSGRSLAHQQRLNSLPSNVKHLKLKAASQGQREISRKNKERGLSLARCSDSEDKLFYTRTSSVLTREHLSSLTLPSHKSV